MNQPSTGSPIRKGFKWGRILQYFLQGLVVMAPVGITIWAIYTIFNTIDSGIIGFIPYEIPKGLGFLIGIGLVVMVGYLSSFLLLNRLFEVFDEWLEKAPGIRFIYSSVKDFFEAFAGNKKKFTKPVVVSLHNNDVWQVGFVTQNSAEVLDLPEHVAVYIPMSYSIAGHVYVVPKERIRFLRNIGPGEAMKFAISGGVTHLEEHHKE